MALADVVAAAVAAVTADDGERDVGVGGPDREQREGLRGHEQEEEGQEQLQEVGTIPQASYQPEIRPCPRPRRNG